MVDVHKKTMSTSLCGCHLAAEDLKSTIKLQILHKKNCLMPNKTNVLPIMLFSMVPPSLLFITHDNKLLGKTPSTINQMECSQKGFALTISSIIKRNDGVLTY